MTNEIKEILDELESMFEISELEEQVNNINKIKNYITNLQEEKENAVECLKYYEEKHFIKPAVDNMKLTIELYNAYLKEINDLQQRIDKAIEYITHEWFKREQIGIAPLQFSYEELQNVLDILRGDE